MIHPSSRRGALLWLAATATCLPSHAQSTSYPNGPVRVIVPFTAGGATDVLARLIAEHLARRWGHPVVVENRPGGNTVVATEAVSKAQPDGHTLGLFPCFSYAINPLILSKLPYDALKDLTGVMLLTRNHLAIYAHPSFPANSIAELVALARREPGKVSYAYATPGVFLGMELFNSMAGTKMGNVPYKGASQALNDLLGGHVQLLVDVVLQSTLEHAKAGRLKVIGNLGLTPSPLTPAAPLPAGVVPGYELTGSFGVFTRAGTPPALIRRIRDDFAEVMLLPDVASRIRDIGQEPIASMPEDLNAYVLAEMKKYAPVVRTTGIRLD